MFCDLLGIPVATGMPQILNIKYWKTLKFTGLWKNSEYSWTISRVGWKSNFVKSDKIQGGSISVIGEFKCRHKKLTGSWLETNRAGVMF